MQVYARSLRTDHGMTLVELVVSVAILFVILTGVLGLVGQTTMMSTTARQQNVMTNALASYTDWLHTQPFESLDSATLMPMTRAEEGFDVVITPTIVAEEEYLKTVSLHIEVTRGDGRMLEWETTVAVRDRSQHMTQSARTPGTDPKIEFTSATVPDGAVVWGGYYGALPLTIQVTARATEGRVIDQVFLYSGSYVLHNTSAQPAEWYDLRDLDTDVWTNSPSFVWDSTYQVDQGDGTFRLAFPYGWHTVTAITYDNLGGQGITTRRFYVDNTPPGDPGPPNASQNPSAPDPLIVWEGPEDTPVWAYQVEVVRQGSVADASSPFAEGSGWSMVGEYTGTEMNHQVSMPPFSRGVARVFAQGPRYVEGSETHRSDWVEGDVFVVRPRLSGVYGVSSNKRVLTADLTVSPPTFPTVGAVTYSFHRVVAGVVQEPPAYSGPLNTYRYVVSSQDIGEGNSFTSPVSFTAQVTFTPGGYQGGTQQVVRSNTVTAATATSVSNATFPVGTW